MGRFCALLTVLTVASPEVAHRWLYYGTGFVFFISPLSYMVSKEEASERSFLGRYVLGISLVFIAFCIWPSLMSPLQPILSRLPGVPPSEEASARQGLPAASAELLRESFRFEETVKLLSRRLPRATMQQHLAEIEEYSFYGTQRQGEMTVDAYLVRKQLIMAMQLMYLTAEYPIGVSYVLFPEADESVRQLRSYALASTEAEAQPPSAKGKIYFLGTRRLAPSLLIKVALREDRVVLKPVYTISYYLSEE